MEGRSFKEPLMVMPVMGIGLGILYAIVDFLLEKYAYQKKFPWASGILINNIFSILLQPSLLLVW